MNSQLKISMLACFSFLLFLTSCTDESVDVSEFADETMLQMESETRSGKLGCYELVYPVSIDFADGSTLEVNDSDEFKAAIIAWKEGNEEVSGRPFLAFPYEIVTENGELITVENRTQRRRLRLACKVMMGEVVHGHLGKPCFRIVYPVTVLFPDESSTEVASRKDLKVALRTWRRDNPDDEEKPMLDFPITVQFEDETTQTVDSREALIRLKKECRE